MLTPKQEAFCAEYIQTNTLDVALQVAGIKLPTTTERFYVYFLVDPMDGRIFYIGKGKGDRLKSHAKEAKRTATVGNGRKIAAINAIITAGFPVKEVVFADDLVEKGAFALERCLIHRLRECGLTNISGGVVTSLEATAAKAEVCLSRMKSYGDWVSTAKRHQIESAARAYGSSFAAYQAIQAEFQQVIDYAKG
jgi:hypothetical protein